MIQPDFSRNIDRLFEYVEQKTKLDSVPQRNYSTIVQQDIVHLVVCAGQKTKLDSVQQAKMVFAASRVFGVAGMVVGGILALAAVKALVVSSLKHFVCIGAIAAVIYTLSHDILVIAQNLSVRKPGADADNRATTADSNDLLIGNKQKGDVARLSETEGTFYRQIWDKCLSRKTL